MAPVMRRPAARAASGRRSPSSQAAWCGSPQAIWTTSVPSCSSSRFSSGTLRTCSDQLHTPMANGSIVMAETPGWEGWAGGWMPGSFSRARGRLDETAQRAEVGAVALADLGERADLIHLQLRHLLRPRPDHRAARRVRLLGQLEGAFPYAAQYLLQHA